MGVIDYDRGTIAEDYQRAKSQAWRSRVEDHSFLALIGDVRGKTVLDVACGEGHFTRMLRTAGAAEVVGCDISQRMIDLARAQEAEHPLGITYVVEDARTVVRPRQDFDVVVSAWLLVYARSRAELGEMCRGLASRVRSGGRFVTVTTNPALYDFDPRPDYRKYGVTMTLADEVYEGAPIHFSLLLPDSELHIDNYYLPIEAYESELTAAGFHDFGVHMPRLSPGDDPPGYWDVFLEQPLLVLMDCVRD